MAAEENTAEPTIIPRTQVKLRRMPIPPFIKPTAAKTKAILASDLSALTPINLEKIQESSGQTIPGLSSKSLWLCPKYSKCTRPCSMMNKLNKNLNKFLSVILLTLLNCPNILCCYLAVSGIRFTLVSGHFALMIHARHPDLPSEERFENTLLQGRTLKSGQVPENNLEKPG